MSAVVAWGVAFMLINAFHLQDDPDIWLNQRVWAWLVIATVLSDLATLRERTRK